MPTAKSKPTTGEKQVRQIKADSGLIYHIIFRQAGTLAKALLEGVMNSIDAGAKEVNVTLTTERFAISDDGKGFVSFEEIEKFFETFGTPHELDDNGISTDAKFGTFRIGRGQLFAFAQTTWQSGEFEMHVDVKNMGLDYELYDGAGPYEGCEINGHLYDALTPAELHDTVRSLTQFVKWVQLPVLLNGDRISTDPETHGNWDEVTDDYYLQYTKLPSSSGVEVFQQGVHVMSKGTWNYGTAALVVTKKPVVLNTARNDILSKCPVWKKIHDRLQVLGGHKLEEKAGTNKNFSMDEQAAVFEKLAAGRMSVASASSLPVFNDSSGMSWSANQVSSMATARSRWGELPNGKLGICFAKKGDPKADKILQRKKALVLDEEMVELAKCDLEEQVVGLICKMFGGSLSRRVSYCQLEDVDSEMSGDHILVPESQVTKTERALLDALGSVNGYGHGVLTHMSSILELPSSKRPSTRVLRVGESDVADGWTDGHSFIAINRKVMKRFTPPSEKLMGCLVHLLVHEYCHDESSSAAHDHPPEFYRLYHDIVGYHAPEMTRQVFMTYCQVVKNRAGKLTSNLGYESRKAAEAAYNGTILEFEGK